MSFIDDAVNSVEHAVSDVANGVEDVVGGAAKAASGAVGLLQGPAGSAVLGILTGGTSSLFSELPQLLGGLSGLLGGSQGCCCPPRPFPFQSPGFDPSQILKILQQLFGGQGQCGGPGQIFPGGTPGGPPIWHGPAFPGGTTSSGIGGQLNNLNTGGISNQINDLMNQATQAAQNGDALTAQKDMIQAQVMFQTISQLMNTIGEMQKQAVQNSRLQ